MSTHKIVIIVLFYISFSICTLISVEGENMVAKKRRGGSFSMHNIDPLELTEKFDISLVMFHVGILIKLQYLPIL